jgi:hypothetical protein
VSTARPDVPDDDPAAAGRSFWQSLAILGSALLIVFVPQIPNEPSGWMAKARPTYRVLWPQGWKFFAESGHAEGIVVYRISAEHDDPPVRLTAPLTARGNLGGLRRLSYARQVEAKQLAGELPAGSWRSCETPVPQCAAQVVPVSRLPVRNRAEAPRLCGGMLFVVQRPVTRAAGVATAVRAVAVEIECRR